MCSTMRLARVDLPEPGIPAIPITRRASGGVLRSGIGLEIPNYDSRPVRTRLLSFSTR